MAGTIVGGGLFFLYMLRAHTYLTDEPSACVNCHIIFSNIKYIDNQLVTVIKIQMICKCKYKTI